MNKRVISLVEVYTWFLPNDLSEFRTNYNLCGLERGCNSLKIYKSKAGSLVAAEIELQVAERQKYFRVMSALGLTLNSLLPSQSLFNEVQLVHNTGYIREDSVSEGSHSTVS